MEKTENIYRKQGNRYIPIGLSIDRSNLTDGIYVVKHKGGDISNICAILDVGGVMKVGELPKLDVLEETKRASYIDKVKAVLVRKLHINASDLAIEIVDILLEMQKNKED